MLIKNAAITLLVVTAAFPVAAQTEARAAKPAASAVRTIEFDAPSVGRKMKYNIVLPEGYDAEAERRYPTLYLLHGLTSNYTAWARMSVPEYAAQYEMIVVMPDAGNSWYVNWAESENGEKNAWEDYMVGDLVGHVDRTFKTIAARKGRAINGLSMGGYGAIMLGLRHPDMFCSIGTHSGALSFAKSMRRAVESGREWGGRRTPSDRADPRIAIEGFSSQKERTPKGKMFATVEDCDRYDPFVLVLEVPADELPHICINCGTGDRLIRSARDFADLLREKEIPFTYAESKGGHRVGYWRREVGHSMAIQHTIIQRHLRSSARAVEGSARRKR